MSRKRKEALTPEGAERVKWYADMQQQLFAHPPEPEMSDDDETDDPMEKSVDTSTNSRISSSRAQSSGLSSSRINTASQPVTPAPTFQNFAASLATESKASMDNHSFHSSSTKLSEKPLKSYPKEILSRALLRLNSPLTIR